MPRKPTYRELERQIAELEAQLQLTGGDEGMSTGAPAAANGVVEHKWAKREMARLASFPILNPSPIVETELDGQVLFANPAAQKLFPDIWARSLDHPFLADWDNLNKTSLRRENTRNHDVIVDERWYSRTVTYLADTQRVRIYGMDITERKHYEEALQQSEKRHRLLAATMLQGVVHQDASGTIIDMNPAAERILGNAREQFLGSSSVREERDTIRDDGSPFPGGEHPSMVALRTGKDVRGVIMGVWNPQMNVHRWISIDAMPVFRPGETHPSEVYTVFEDITDRRQADAQFRKAHDELEQKVQERTLELQQVNRKLRMSSECNQVLVRAKNEQELTRDICRVILEVGEYRMAWVGYAEDDSEKTVLPVASLGFEEGYLENAKISWADTDRGRGPTGTCIRTGAVCIGHDFLKDPELAPWRLEALKRGFRSSIALPLKSEERVFGAITIYAEEPYAFEHGTELLREFAEDLAFGLLTIRSHKERDVAIQIAEKRAGQLQALTADLVQTEQKERRQIARILHDHLQQLLVGAKFGASFIQAKTKSKDIKETAEQLVETLDESIRASRSLTADLSPPVLHEKGLAAGLEWLGRRMMEKHGLVLELQVDATAEPASEQVRIFLFESVRELLLNIVKHAKVNSAQIRMRRLESDEIELVVADNGIGFDPAKAELHQTTGGFGLFSIRERINYFGGHIDINTSPGQGSCFTIVTPARLSSYSGEGKGAEGEDIQFPRDITPVEGNRPSTDTPISVLIADDHPVMRQGLSKLLEEQPDIRVIGKAGTGQEAVNMAWQLKPDVILMDIGLPDISGYDATRQILSDCPEISVIGLSMYEKSDAAEAMLKAGAIAYLTKGEATGNLISAIRAGHAQKSISKSCNHG